MKRVLLTSIIFFIGLIICMSENFNYNNNVVISNEDLIKNYTNTISMMYETDPDSGVYEESKDTKWPISGYVFNETLSKCEQGSTLIWDNEQKNIRLTSNVSDKCYVYFDIYIPPTIANTCKHQDLANCIKDNYTLDNNIYYHSSTLENGAKDNSYRYAGSYENVNNYVCFGSDEETCPWNNMYRIIGIFDSKIKLIKADYATLDELGTSIDCNTTNPRDGTNKGKNSKNQIRTCYWNYNNNSSNSANIWANSNLNKVNLNETFLNKFNEYWQGKIATTAWQVGGNTYEKIVQHKAAEVYQDEFVSPVTGQPAVTNKIGLMYASDFGFAASPSGWTTILNSYHTNNIQNTNWMYGGLMEWTITRDTSTYTNSHAFNISCYGFVNSNYAQSSSYSVRPVFYLNDGIILINGLGTISSPFRLG